MPDENSIAPAQNTTATMGSETPRKHMLDFLAFATAMVALLVSIYSAQQTREHNRLSVVPYLNVTDSGPFRYYEPDSDPKLEVSIVNNGAGVAVIESVDITTDLSGATEIKEVLRVSGLTKSKYFVWWNHSMPYYLRAGETLYMFKSNESKLSGLTPELRATELQNLADRLKRLKIVIKYRSIYGESAVATWPRRSSTPNLGS